MDATDYGKTLAARLREIAAELDAMQDAVRLLGYEPYTTTQRMRAASAEITSVAQVVARTTASDDDPVTADGYRSAMACLEALTGEPLQ